MVALNKVMLIGNVGNDPEYKQFENGSVANLSLATSYKYKDKTGEAKEVTDWHRIVFKNKLADIVYKYVKKGSRIYIEGAIKNRKYMGKDNLEKWITEIVANEMIMLDGKKDQDSYAAKNDLLTPSKMAETKNYDDIPF